MMWDAHLPISAIYRHILPARHISDYGLHGICGMTDSVVAATGKSLALMARTLVQPTLKVARLVVKTYMRGNVSCEGANEKGKVRFECATAVHLVRNKGPETLIDECVHKGGMEAVVLHDNSR